MAYVEEKLTEQDKEFIARFQFKAPFGLGSGLAKTPSEWAADKERKYYLICLGGQGWRSYDTDEYPPNYYKLIMGNKVVEIAARICHEGTIKTGVTVYWKLEGIYVDKTIDLQKEELLKIVEEAFVFYANIHYNGHVVKVCMDYVAEPYYTEI